MKKEEVQALQEACKVDLKFLCKNVLNMNDWDDYLHDDVKNWLETSGQEKLIIFPRGHFKSSIITVAWTIQQLLKDPNIRILITNFKFDQARIFLNQISAYLTYNSVLPKIFGEFKDEKKGRWAQEEITIAQKSDPSKRGPSIAIAGLETELTGSHYDLIIHDDLVGPKNIGTREQLEKTKDFYRQSRSLLDPGGRMVLIGTRWHNEDLYGMVLNTLTKTVNRKPIKMGEVNSWLEAVEK